MLPKVLFGCLFVAFALESSVMIADAQGPKPGRAPRAALGTAFTYQGQLKNGGALVNGTCAFNFGLWDASAAGNQVGITQTVGSVSVTNGLFTTPVDFGANAFTGDARWLDIQVRCPAGSGSFTPMSARQLLTATPYSLYSTNAATAMSLSGSFAGDVTGSQTGTTVSAVGGKTASTIATAVDLANNATNVNTEATIVRRDTLGNFAAGTITANLAGNASTATSLSGSFSGDVTGSQTSMTVSAVGGKTASTIATAADLANNATNVNTPATIVRRDTLGNFAAGTITANLAGNASTATNFSGSLAGDVTGTQASTTVAKLQGRNVSSTAPASGQVLRYDSSQWLPTNSNTLSGSIAGIYSWADLGSGLAPNATAPVFFGPTTPVTTNATQRITGSAIASMGLAAASNAFVFIGLCYQPSAGGALSFFASNRAITIQMTTTLSSYTAANSVVPGAGTWNVGFCVVNATPEPIISNYVNGWVMVTN